MCNLLFWSFLVNFQKLETPPRDLSYDDFHAIITFLTQNCVLQTIQKIF